MYDVSEIQQDYRQKWLEAERDLLLLGKDFPLMLPDSETLEITKENADIVVERCPGIV